MKNISFLPDFFFFLFLEVKYSIYLNRRVFVMFILIIVFVLYLNEYAPDGALNNPVHLHNLISLRGPNEESLHFHHENIPI